MTLALRVIPEHRLIEEGTKQLTIRPDDLKHGKPFRSRDEVVAGLASILIKEPVEEIIISGTFSSSANDMLHDIVQAGRGVAILNLKDWTVEKKEDLRPYTQLFTKVMKLPHCNYSTIVFRGLTYKKLQHTPPASPVSFTP